MDHRPESMATLTGNVLSNNASGSLGFTVTTNLLSVLTYLQGHSAVDYYEFLGLLGLPKDSLLTQASRSQHYLADIASALIGIMLTA